MGGSMDMRNAPGALESALPRMAPEARLPAQQGAAAGARNLDEVVRGFDSGGAAAMLGLHGAAAGAVGVHSAAAAGVGLPTSPSSVSVQEGARLVVSGERAWRPGQQRGQAEVVTRCVALLDGALRVVRCPLALWELDEWVMIQPLACCFCHS